MCYNCRHRVTGRCEYDPVPKRRGPDRMPGSRQRPGHSDCANEESNPAVASGEASTTFESGGGEGAEILASVKSLPSQGETLTRGESQVPTSRRRKHMAAESSKAVSRTKASRSKSRGRVAPAAAAQESCNATSKLAPALPVPSQATHPFAQSANEYAQGFQRAHDGTQSFGRVSSGSPNGVPGAIFEADSYPSQIDTVAHNNQYARHNPFEHSHTYEELLHPQEYPAANPPRTSLHHHSFAVNPGDGTDSLHRLASRVSDPDLTMPTKSVIPSFTGTHGAYQQSQLSFQYDLYTRHPSFDGRDINSHLNSLSYEGDTIPGPPLQAQAAITDNVIDPALMSGPSHVSPSYNTHERARQKCDVAGQSIHADTVFKTGYDGDNMGLSRIAPESFDRSSADAPVTVEAYNPAVS